MDYPIKVTEVTEDVIPSEPVDGLPQDTPIPFASDHIDIDTEPTVRVDLVNCHSAAQDSI